MVTDGGGWTVLVRRLDGSVNFTKEWEDFKVGFGVLNGEFYAGNEIVHQLTVDDNRSYSLRVDLEAYDNESVFALYTDFFIGPESDNYRFHVHGYLSNSTAGDSLTNHDGMMFSTASHDNDMADDFNCAASLRPWWHDRCFLCSLFGLYGEYPIIPDNKGIKWMYNWGSL
ncbi:hypothetical protein LSH36_1845g00053, partial [Paralvinella palmiformis]